MKKKFDLLSYVLGIATVVLFYVMYTCISINMERHNETEAIANAVEMDAADDGFTDDTSTENEQSADIIDYNTDIKDWEINTADGKKIPCSTPKDMYSLSDQYLSMLSSMYGVADLKSDNFVVVGDQTSPSSCNYIINAATLSATADLLSQMSGEETKVEDMEKSEAYVYMTTGKLPEGVDDSFTIDEIEEFKIGDVGYKVYKIAYDYEYTVSENAAPEYEHIEQLVCYTDNEDSLEIYVAAQTFDESIALSMLHDFVGYTK